MNELFQELTNYHGRFNRARYISYHFAINIFHSIISKIVEFILPNIIGNIIQIALVIIGMYFLTCLLIKRAHDLDKSGKFVWLYYIPIINIYPAILFTFVKGTDGLNQYGQDPLEDIYSKETA